MPAIMIIILTCAFFKQNLQLEQKVKARRGSSLIPRPSYFASLGTRLEEDLEDTVNIHEMLMCHFFITHIAECYIRDKIMFRVDL